MKKLYAKVLLDGPEGYTANGEMFIIPPHFEWQDVEWLDPWDCDHQETMCTLCVDTWSIDYEIELPDGVHAPVPTIN